MRALKAVVVVLALNGLVAAPAGANFDVFDEETLNDRAFGQEIPYTDGAPRQFVASFNTIDFGLDTDEDASGSNNLNGCLEAPAVFAGRTGWARFNPDVAGRIHVLAQTPTYDSIVWIREAREAAWGTTTFSDVRASSRNNCSDINNAAGDEETIYPPSPNPSGWTVRPDYVYYVQVGGKCPGGLSTCRDAGVPGGNTTIRLTFTPDDSDSDGVPDTHDLCVGGSRGFVTPDGCPDTDQDSIRDDQEGPGCVGQRGVAAPAPYNGCFDGPTPPSTNPPAVVITSRDGNPDSTSSINVDLHLNWPRGARQAVGSNGISVNEATPIALQPRVAWQLRPATRSETREVKVTFLGPGISLTVTDTITLDPNPPTVPRYLLAPSRFSEWYLGVTTADDRSGVRRIEALDTRRRLIRRVDVCRTTRGCRRRVARALELLNRKPRYLRVTDAAGNSVRRLLARTAGCRIKVWVIGRPGSYDCFRPGNSCRGRRGFAWGRASPPLRCTRGRVRRR